jgi:hypothetical protein
MEVCEVESEKRKSWNPSQSLAWFRKHETSGIDIQVVPSRSRSRGLSRGLSRSRSRSRSLSRSRRQSQAVAGSRRQSQAVSVAVLLACHEAVIQTPPVSFSPRTQHDHAYDYCPYDLSTW